MMSMQGRERRRKARMFESEARNSKLSERIGNIKSTIPNQRDLALRYQDHQKTKSLRCQFPIVDLRRSWCTTTRWNQAQEDDNQNQEKSQQDQNPKSGEYTTKYSTKFSNSNK